MPNDKKRLIDLDLNGNEIQNAVFQNLATAPTNPKEGQVYYNTADDTLYVYADGAWVNALSQGGYTFQNGIEQVSNSMNVQIKLATGNNAGNVSFTADSNGLAGSVDLSGKVDKLVTKPTAGDYTKVTINSEGQVTDGTTLSASDIPNLTLSKITDVTASSSEVNILDGATLSTTELNYVDGVTSSIQTQLNNKLAEKPDGTHDLISSNKITLTYVPDVLLGQMLYAGTFVPSTGVATLSTNAKTKLDTTSATITLTNDTTATTGYGDNEGNYYLTSASGTFATISFVTGDWLVSTGSGWTKIDNTDAVTGIKGDAESSYRIGNVNITADNVMPTQTGNSGKYLTTDGTNVSWGSVDALPSQSGNSGKFLTTNGTTASWATTIGKITAQNSALTPSSGVCTWTITNTLNTADVHVIIKEVSSGSEVVAGVSATSSTITITMNSTSTIAADTYRAIIIG